MDYRHVVLVLVVVARTAAVVCPRTEAVCELWLVVEQRLTMLTTVDGFPKPVVALNDSLYVVTSLPKDDVGVLFPLDASSPEPEIVREVSGNDVIYADGYPKHKLVYVVNGTLPGPKIECYEGQILRIHVTNRLMAEMTGIHWHGMHQKGTPRMDGVPFVTQDPILPGQTFTYQFEASPKGTHYYHAHVGMQITMGVYGALIVHPQQRQTEFAQEYTILLADWNHEWTGSEAFARWTWTAVYSNGRIYRGNRGPDDKKYGSLFANSGLLNGKGRFRDRKTGNIIPAPLEEFRIEPGKKYLFRVINAVSHAQFLLAFEDHDFELKASDGYELKRGYIGQGLAIASGERYDLVLTGKNVTGRSVVLAKTMERPYPVFAEALLKYSDAETGLSPKDNVLTHCSSQKPCTIFNCPTETLSEEVLHSNCINIERLERLASEPAPPQGEVREYFLNFGYPAVKFYEGASVNAKVFKPPTRTIIDTREIEFPCDVSTCVPGGICHCTQILRYRRGEIVQLVFLNLGMNAGGGHPIHIHGHSFHVVSLGYPNRDQNGNYLSLNSHLSCSHRFCDNVTWSSDDVTHVNVDGPIKDTINVPRGGYAVVRFRADNPGFWMLHCHQEIHLVDGMAVLLGEALNEIPAA